MRAGSSGWNAAATDAPGEWLVEYDHVTHRFSLAAALADPAHAGGAGEKSSSAPVDPHDRSSLRHPSGGPRLAVLNAAAEAAGLAPGQSLADARTKAGALQVRESMPQPTQLRCSG